MERMHTQTPATDLFGREGLELPKFGPKNLNMPKFGQESLDMKRVHARHGYQESTYTC